MQIKITEAVETVNENSMIDKNMMLNKLLLRGLRWARLERQRDESKLEDRRNQFAFDILQQVKNEVQETLLLHAPTTWPDERLDLIEQQVMDRTRLTLDTLNIDEIQSADAFQFVMTKAVAKTKHLIRVGGVRV